MLPSYALAQELLLFVCSSMHDYQHGQRRVDRQSQNGMLLCGCLVGDRKCELLEA